MNVSRYRRVRSLLWLERAFLDINEGERLTALYCQTGPQTNGLGLSRFSLAAAAEDFACSQETMKRRFDAVCKAFNWRFDPRVRVLWIPTWLEENSPQSPNVVKSWRAAFNEVPDCELKAEAAIAIQAFLKAKGEAFREAFGEASRDVFPIREQEQFREQVQQHYQAPNAEGNDHKPEPTGKDVHAFIKCFCELYKEHGDGAIYQVKSARDIPLVRTLLRTYGHEHLESMARLLLTVDDEWVCQTDRGLGILSTKASWLDLQLSRRPTIAQEFPAFVCPHAEPKCTDRNSCHVRDQIEKFKRGQTAEAIA